jgi:hypothetical protein
VCVPGCTVDECFEGRPPIQREIYERLLAHLATLGPVHIDAVRVGIFLKTDRKLAEVRPKARSLSLELVLPRAMAHPRVVRTITIAADRVAHVVKLPGLDDVDDEVREMLTQAYNHATD